MRATRQLALTALLLNACGGTSVVVATMTGASPPEGGGYRLEALNVDGSSREGSTAQFVSVKSGEQSVTMTFDSGAFFVESDTERLILRVSLVDSDGDDAAITGVGASLVELPRGGLVEIPVTVAERPITIVGGATVSFSPPSDASEEDPQPRELSATLPETSAPTGLSYQLWGHFDDDTWKLIPATGDDTLIVGGFDSAARLSDRTDLSFALSLEPIALDGLVRPLGFLLFEGAMPSGLRSSVGEVLSGLRRADNRPLSEDGALERLLSLLTFAWNHSRFAQNAAGSNTSGARNHCEHVHNLLASTDDDQNLNADSNPTDHGVSNPDTVGIQLYLDDISDAVTDVENLTDVDRGVAVLQAQTCIGEMEGRLAQALAAAEAAFPPSSSDLVAEVTALRTLVVDLRDLPDTTEGSTPIADMNARADALCLQDSLWQMTEFSLSAL